MPYQVRHILSRFRARFRARRISPVVTPTGPKQPRRAAPQAPAAPPPGPPQPPPPPPPPAGPKAPQLDFQLRWPEAEVSRIGTKVLSDYRNALADHNRRISKWREYYRRWRCIVDVPQQGEETYSNVPVPFIRWNIFTKWAKEMDALFGDDAEIEAVPVGPSDYRKDRKIGRYMTWRVFNAMKLLNPFCEFVLRKLIFGKSVAYSPWKRDTFDVAGKEIVDYEGPDFEPLWPDDLIVPAEEVKTIHEFSFVIRKYRITPDDLLKGEDAGRYQGITKNWDTILNFSRNGMQRQFEGDEIKLEKDEAEGIMMQRPLSSGEWITVLEWYGKWRPLKNGERDGGEWDFDRREMRQKDFVIRYLLNLNIVISIQSLEDLYPTIKDRRPFVESSMCKDGTYWSPGMSEMLLDLEDELRVNHNLGTEAAQLACNPPMAYRPASGVTPDTIRIEPGIAIPLDNPSEDLLQIKIASNLETVTWKEQVVLGYGEKLTGLSDLQLGRQSDRPNAPRTATQTVKLLEEGNVRISLDTKVLREDMAIVLTHFWELEFMFSPEQVFFRVTEEDADGLFETKNGAAEMTRQDRDGRYDFRLNFANSIWSKETMKEQALARYQLDLQNPLIITNSRALWAVTRDAHEALGDPTFGDLVPEPPAPDLSMDPKEEWARMQEGEAIHVNPQDNDQEHMLRHFRDWQESTTDPNRDPEAVHALEVHYQQHLAQLQQKKLQQAIIEQAVQHLAQIQAGETPPGQPGGVLNFPGGIFGSALEGKRAENRGPQPPKGNPLAYGPNLYPGHPENLHGAS